MQVIKHEEHKDILSFVHSCVPDEIHGFKLNLKDKIAWVLNGIEDFPMCHECKKMLKRHAVTVVLGYQRHRTVQQHIFCS